MDHKYDLTRVQHTPYWPLLSLFGIIVGLFERRKINCTTL